MRLSELRNKTCTVEIEHQGETLKVEFRLNAVTPDFLLELSGIKDSDENLTHQLRGLVARWDLLDDHGEEIPVSLDLVRSVPRHFWIKVIDAIAEAIRVDDEEKKT